MSKNSINLIIGFIFLAVTVVGFGWLWISSNQEVISTISGEGKYKTVSINKEKAEAIELMSTLQANSDIPLNTPTEKMGKKTNPFK